MIDSNTDWLTHAKQRLVVNNPVNFLSLMGLIFFRVYIHHFLNHSFIRFYLYFANKSMA